MTREPGFVKRAPRTDLGRSAVLIDSQGVERSVDVLDVSTGGFKLKVPDMVRIGEMVKLRLDGSDDIDAQIRWALGDEAGGEFLNPADYSRLS